MSEQAQEKKWTGTTYGNGWMHKWLIRLLRWTDVRVIYAINAVIIVPACLLFRESRSIIYRYFRERQGYGVFKAAWKTYVNHCLFSQVVVDKFAMYAGKTFNIETEGYDHFLALAAQKEGFVQLSSHIGNYEIAGYTLVAESKPFHALVPWEGFFFIGSELSSLRVILQGGSGREGRWSLYLHGQCLCLWALHVLSGCR